MSTAYQPEPAFLNRLAWADRWSDRKRSRASAHQALELARSRGDDMREVATALRTLAWQAKWRGDFDRAQAHALACEAAASEAMLPGARGDCYSILGVVHYSRGRFDLATCAVERGMKLVDLGVPDETQIDLLTTLSTIQRYQGHVTRSGMTLARARDMATERELARVEHNLARWMHQHGDMDGGLRHARISIALAEEYRNRVILPYAAEIAGACAVELGQADEASVFFNDALQWAVADEDTRAQCQILIYSAALKAGQGDSDKALDLLHHGAALADEMGYPLWQKSFALKLAEVHEARGDLSAALEAHKSAWAIQNSARDEYVGSFAPPR